jgi:uncharacterized membrane protein YjgN (DUF898 family)
MSLMVTLFLTFVGIGLGMSYWALVAERRYLWRER